MTRKDLFFASLLFVLLSHRLSFGLDLDAYPEYLRPGPDGTAVSADRSAGEPHGNLYIGPKTIRLRAARNGYVSFFVVVKQAGETPYSLSLQLRPKIYRHSTAALQDLVSQAPQQGFRYSGRADSSHQPIQFEAAGSRQQGHRSDCAGFLGGPLDIV